MPEPTRVAGVVLRDQSGRYLLVQEGKGSAAGLWNLPAGHVDKGETVQQAAIREGNEETGLQLALVFEEPLLVDSSEADIEKYAFYAKITGGQLQPPQDEIAAARWFTTAEIKQLSVTNKIRSDWVTRAINKVEAKS